MRSRPPFAMSAAAKAGATKKDAHYGQGSHSIDVADYEMADPDDLRDKLLAIFKSPAYKPPVLPGVALELTDLTRKANASYEDVIRVLERDPMIVANVLKVAQSPMYSTKQPAQSLKDALNRLGINTLRDIVWQVVANMRLFRVKGYTTAMQRLQQHSLFTAHLARLVAMHAGIAGEHAFLCGLLHDVGISGTLIALGESAGTKEPPRLATILPAIDKIHAEASGTMGRLWGLAPEIVAVIGVHHSLDPRKEAPNVLIPVLCVAEHLATELGGGILSKEATQVQGHSAIDHYLPGRFEYAVTRLKLDTKLGALKAQAEQIAAKVGGGGS